MIEPTKEQQRRALDAIRAKIEPALAEVEREANARLIAAAPDLLACLEDLLGLVTEGFHPEDIAVRRSVEAARAAISKATGETR